MTSDWKEYKLKDVLREKGYIRGPFGSALKRGELKNSGIPVYEQQHAIYNNRVFRFFIDDKKYAEMKRFSVETNDLLISCSGTVGKVTIIKETDPRGIISQALLTLSADNSIILPLYLKYFFESNEGYNSIISRSSGSVQVNIAKREVIENIPIKLPDLETQRKIARVLGAIDDKIELNNSINKNLEQQIKSIYSNSFNNSNNLIDISDLIDIRDGTHDSPKPQKEGKKLITSKHLLKYGVDISSANLISETDYEKINERSRVETNDILISMIGTVGIVSYIIENPVDFAVKNVGIYRTSQKPEYSYYIHCYLNSTETQNYILSHLAGTTQKYISLSELRTLKVNIPNQSELENFNKLVKPMYDNIINLTKENERLTQLRDTLLPKLMNGEIDVDKVEVK